jgi:uncharacterized beta-barrel protein YwiB (DUF1934 family)
MVKPIYYRYNKGIINTFCRGYLMGTLKKRVQIELKTVVDDEGEQEHSVIKETGDYYQKGSVRVVMFTDRTDDVGDIKTTIQIHPGKVTVKRSGAISMYQQFIEGEKSVCVYRHPYGMFPFDIHTHSIKETHMDERLAGELVITYDAITEETIRKHQVTLTYTEEI